MVLTRADKDEMVELINNTLNKYLSNAHIAKNVAALEKLSSDVNLSITSFCERIEDRIVKLEKEHFKLRERLNSYEQYSRRNCLRVFGVEEEENENVHVKVKNIFDKMHINTEGHIDRCHRIGKKFPGKNVNNLKTTQKTNTNNRCIIVKFTSYFKRNEVFKNKKLLKGNLKTSPPKIIHC